MAPRKSWNSAAMVTAIIAVRNKDMGYKAAAKLFNVPRATLKDYVKSPHTPEECVSTKFGRKPVFSSEHENSLVEYCLDMDHHYYGLTISDLRRMAYQLAVKNNLPNPFSRETKAAGKKWVRLFFKRHPELTLRRPQNLSIARAKGFTKDNVHKFFSLLKVELERINFDPSKIFNVDETGISVVQHKASRVVTSKGQKQVHRLSSAERGATITVITCMSAAGHYIPPLLIFPQKRWQVELLDGAPPGSIGGTSESGWVTGPLFLMWFEHFISIVKPTKEAPVVLILDGHYSHTRNVEVIDRTREVGVSIVCLPPHSTDKMQPLDVAFMFPLKTLYAKAIEQWLANNPNRIVRKLQVSSLFCEAYLQAATLETAANGFRATGIHPFNPDVFQEHHFAAKTMEVVEESVNDETAIGIAPTGPPQVIRPRDIREVPIIQASTSARAGTSFLVTGSPHKTALTASLEKRKNREKRQTKGPAPQTKKQLNMGSTCQPVPGASSKLTKPRRKQTRRCDVSSSDTEDETHVPLVSTDDEDSSDEGDVSCPICGKKLFAGQARRKMG
ncbi:uncharacterized protein LOC134527734 [Bacillus rossius redtenbacheri]|uniref:uncharacterized protein LOC134527734 n=1 Tax=Bacillus rossius redtenbacheri TaxID=93214 RepID=UPI002FDDEE2F